MHRFDATGTPLYSPDQILTHYHLVAAALEDHTTHLIPHASLRVRFSSQHAFAARVVDRRRFA